MLVFAVTDAYGQISVLLDLEDFCPLENENC